MDKILEKLLVPDNSTILEGTKELRDAFKNPEIVPMLCNVIGTSSNPQVRQYAALLLRKKLNKFAQWSKIPLDVRLKIKEGLLTALVNEQEKFVKTSIGQVIGTLVRHEFPNQTWPELMEWLQQMTTSQSERDKELGFFTLQILTDISTDQFLNHRNSFAMLFVSTLNSLTDPSSITAYLTLETMTNFVSSIEGDQTMVNAYNDMMPKVIEIIKALSKNRPNGAVKAFELLDKLIEDAICVLVPHLKSIVEMCLEISLDKSVEMDLQIKALSVIDDLIISKKKTIVKRKLVEPILEVIFTLMTSAPEHDDTEEYFAEDVDTNTTITAANQTLDVMALHLPPEKLIPPLLKYVLPGLQNNYIYVKKASFLAMGIVSEGCADYIRNHHLKDFLATICEGINNPAAVVANAALFCLGQFSENLQPEISEYSEELLPVLLQHLGKLAGSTAQPPGGVDKMFYALEMFCENLNDALLPYLPVLMQHLIPLLLPPHVVRLRELAISAIGACGNAAKEGMLPYFPEVIENLKMYLTQPQDDDTMCLQVQAIDTLGVLARTIGENNFRPMAQESLELGLHLMKSNDDPDLRKSVYGLFASIASVLKEEMSNALPAIIDPIVKSIKSSEGIAYHLKDSEDINFPVYDDLSDQEEEEDIGQDSDVSDDEDIQGYTVENSYMEEKEEAILALKELAEHTGAGFLPYLEGCFEEVFKMLNYPQEDIRTAAISAIQQFCINFYRIQTSDGNTALSKALRMVIPKFSEIIRLDCEREVVMNALEACNELLKQAGPAVLEGEGHRDAIINCVKDVLNHRTECQDASEEDQAEAEHDEMLIESAGEIVPNLGKAMPCQQFAEHFTQFLPMFINLTKNQCPESQRSFGVGVIAESMAPIGSCLHMFAAQLLPLLISWSQDESGEVRNNAIYAIGEMAYHGKETIYPMYVEILQALSQAVSVETSPGALDNICGAIARLMITNINAVPVDQVLPVFIKYLPLREDYDENKWVFRCLCHLYQLGTKILINHLVPVITASALTLHHNQIEPENKELILNLIQMCHRDFPSECIVAMQNLPQDVATVLQQICLS